MRLKITPTIRNAWQVRAITDLIPELAKLPWETANAVDVDTKTASEIRTNCAWYITYRSMLRQIDAAFGY